MTPTEINVAIAEACGWTHNEGVPGWWFSPNKRTGHETVPNYHGDLNAMHEAENWLERGCEEWFAEEGSDGCVGDAYVWNLQELCNSDIFSLVGAQPSQRAEAFLRTLGKWAKEETQK